MRRTTKNVVLVTMIFPVAFNLAGCPDRSTVEESRVGVGLALSL